MAKIDILKSAPRLLGIGFILTVLNSCIVAPDTYQGNGTWVKADGTTYQAAPPVRVTNVAVYGRARVREIAATVEDQDKNAQGQTVVRQRTYSQIGMDVKLLVTLENGEQHYVQLTFGGEPGETDHEYDTFTANNGNRYTVSGNLRVSTSPTNLNFRVTSKGLPTYQGSLTVR